QPVEFSDGYAHGPSIKAGWFPLAAPEAWIAAHPGYDPEDPGAALDPDPDPEPEASALALAVAKFLDGADDPALVELAEEHAAVMTALVRAYTRGRGFGADGEPVEDVRAVIVTATARLVSNPEQADNYAGGAGVRGRLVGFWLPEQIVLNAYRRRSAVS